MVPFLTMRHGFLTRGDISDPDVAAEVQNTNTSGVAKVEKCPHDYIVRLRHVLLFS